MLPNYASVNPPSRTECLFGPAAIVLLVLWAIPGRAEPLKEDRSPAPAIDTISSGGKRVTAERFEPKQPGKHPAVLFLYGVDGLHEGNADVFRGAARRLAAEGFVVLLVHYHDRTGTGLKDVPAFKTQFQRYLEGHDKPGGPKEAVAAESFRAWTGAVRDAASHARGLSVVDSERLGVIGYSLGGYLATELAAEVDQRMRAVVSLFGGINRDTGANLRQFPPALLVAGDKDDVVPVTESHRLRDLLRARKLTCEAQVYAGVGHGFLTADGKPNIFAALDAEQRIVAFLKKHLAPKADGAAPRPASDGNVREPGEQAARLVR